MTNSLTSGLPNICRIIIKHLFTRCPTLPLLIPPWSKSNIQNQFQKCKKLSLLPYMKMILQSQYKQPQPANPQRNSQWQMNTDLDKRIEKRKIKKYMRKISIEMSCRTPSTSCSLFWGTNQNQRWSLISFLRREMSLEETAQLLNSMPIKIIWNPKQTNS